MQNRKQVFITIFISVSVILTVLPALMAISSLLTRLFLSMEWYVWLQRTVVPFEARLVAVLVKFIGIAASVPSSPDQFVHLMLKKQGGGFLGVELQWNCLGWQSMILLGLTLIGGLRGRYTFSSKLETITFGIIGTFLINLLRMAIIVALAFYWNDFAAMIMHDYLATLVAFIWIVFFWWFSYRHLLEPKTTPVEHKNH